MLPNPLHFLSLRFAHVLAWGISFVSVNKIRRDSIQANSITKSRTPWNWIPVTLGNLVFRFRVPAIRVFPTSEWIEWESAIQLRLGNKFERFKSGVRSQQLSGEPLASLLKQPQYSERQKRDWVELACKELAKLHQIRLDVGDVMLSHADASVSNVMLVPLDGQAIEENQGTATFSAIWFDFDLGHDLGVSMVARRADDLRALIFTSVVCCRWERLQVLIEGIKQAYNNPNVWTELSQTVSHGGLQMDIFHLAQLRRANRSTAHWDQIEQAIELIK